MVYVIDDPRLVGFKKQGDYWVYTKMHIVPTSFPIVLRKDKSEQYKISATDFKEKIRPKTYDMPFAGTGWGAIFIVMMVLSALVSLWFLLLIPFCLSRGNIEANKLHDEFYKLARKHGSKLGE